MRIVKAIKQVTISAVGLTLLLSSFGCSQNLTNIKQDIDLRSQKRYSLGFEPEYSGLTPQLVLNAAQENNYWIRAGNEGEAQYFKGKNICTECNYANENLFITENRLYYYPVQFEYLAYVYSMNIEFNFQYYEGKLWVFLTPQVDLSTKLALETFTEIILRFDKDYMPDKYQIRLRELPSSIQQ